MLTVYLKSIGILAPGINHWQDAVRIFTQPEQYQSEPVARKLKTLLPPNERRRATRVTQLALHVAQQACEQYKAEYYLQVFSCSNGDINTFHRISQALAMSGQPVSPTLFHNSVHNAAAGYWSIATQCQTASTSISAYIDSFSTGLLEAAVQLLASDNDQHRNCLLVCYEELPPAPFLSITGISQEFSCALMLGLDPEGTLARLDISIGDGSQAVTKSSIAAMETLRQANPQAVALPLLEHIAKVSQTDITEPEYEIVLPYFQQGLTVTITPVSS